MLGQLSDQDGADRTVSGGAAPLLRYAIILMLCFTHSCSYELGTLRPIMESDSLILYAVGGQGPPGVQGFRMVSGSFISPAYDLALCRCVF